MSGVSRKPGEQVIYKYRLNKNHKSKGDSISLNGVMVYKSQWANFDKSQKDKLKTYLKNFNNPKGIVDEYIFDPLKEFSMVDPNSEIKFEHKRKFYTRDVLCTFTRKELESICKEYLIDTRGKINSFLIQVILKEQDMFRSSLENTDDFFDENNKIPKED